MNKQKPGLPASLLQLLEAAEKTNGLPAGTMSAVMQQEIGGQLGKFLTNPSAYHYEAGPDGRRIAKHTGKVSTAFGPFGILESTAADPGYGVKPLKDKSLEEQVRFSAEYLAARAKRSGGLVQGLAAYGEGGKYGAQVASRIAGSKELGLPPPNPVASVVPPVQPAPVVTATAPAPVAPGATVEVPSPVPVGPDPWAAFLAQAQAKPEAKPSSNGYQPFAGPQMVIPDFLGTVAQVPAQKIRMSPFAGLSSWGV